METRLTGLVITCQGQTATVPQDEITYSIKTGGDDWSRYAWVCARFICPVCGQVHQLYLTGY